MDDFVHRRVHLFLNPDSGIGSAHYLFDRIVSELAPLEVHHHFLAKGEAVRPLVKEALDNGATDVVAVGGDGTLSAVAEGLVGTGVALGIIPTGTANMVAREIGIPLSVASAARAIKMRARVGALDAMAWGDRSFIYQVVIGSGADAASRISREEKRTFGRGAYAIAGMRMLADYHPINVRCTVDGQLYRMWVHQLIIANAGILGLSPMRLGPAIRPDDGKIDVVAMRGRTRLNLFLSSLEMMMGNYQSGGLFYLDVSKEVTVEAEGTCHIKADGEFIGAPPITIRVVPAAIRVILPPEKIGEANGL